MPRQNFGSCISRTPILCLKKSELKNIFEQNYLPLLRNTQYAASSAIQGQSNGLLRGLERNASALFRDLSEVCLILDSCARTKDKTGQILHTFTAP